MKKIQLLLLAAAICLSLGACEKILNKEPQDQLSVEKTFSTFQGTRTALAGAYSSLLSINLYHMTLMVYPDLMGGNIKYSKSTNLSLSDVYNLTQKPLDCTVNATYETAYATLNNINNIIKYTPDVPDASLQQRNRLLADAYALRALLHFDLVNIYGKPYNAATSASQPGIVVNLQPRLYSDPLPVRSTVAQTYQAIINDLLLAAQLYDNSTAIFTSGASQTYFSKNAVKALLSKVYLYQGDWQNAFTYANDVITTGGYTLLSNASYVTSWATRTPSSESIFELALESNFSGNSVGTYYESGSSYQQFAATNDLLSLYTSTDVRGRSSLFNSQVISGTTYYFTRKYEKGGTNATPVKVLRLSDLYLIRAEASARLNAGALTTALADLNTIRMRADASATALGQMTQANLLTAILTERRKELAFEGNLVYDLLRTGSNIARADCSSAGCNVPNTDTRLIMPIPTSTINVNPTLEQNPGY